MMIKAAPPAGAGPAEPAFFWFALALVAVRSAVVPAEPIITEGTMPLKVSSIGPAPGVVDNPLPAFFWQGLGIEGSMPGPYTGPYKGEGVPPFVPARAGPGGGAGRSDPALERQCDADGACRGQPCQMCHPPGFDGVSLLPWTRQDMWGCERQEMDVPVIEVETPAIKAIITPQWGGKIWSVYHKNSSQELFMRNPALQPTDYSMRKAWVSGGVEWNWTPGMCGHSPFTLSPTYVAKIPTERGDLVRVWEYDRVNHTVWSVDMLFEDDGTVWSHPRITNPTAEDLNGYWWTNVGQKITVDGKQRVVMPAKYDYVGVPWPGGNYFFAADGLGQDEGADCGLQNFTGLGFGADFSFVGNLPTGHDFFMRLCDNETQPPLWGGRSWIPEHCRLVPARSPAMHYIALAQEDGSTVLHAHRGAGTKFFFHQRTSGPNFIQRFMAAATPHNSSAPAPPDSAGIGLYLEAQTGVAPSQSHVFPLPKNSSTEWTEWFRAWKAAPQEIHAPEYATAVGAVESWLASPDGVAEARFAEMEAFFAKHSADAPQPQNILKHGLPWGGLEEARRGGAPLAAGTSFDPPADWLKMEGRTPLEAAALTPWLELLGQGQGQGGGGSGGGGGGSQSYGTFSDATLERLPGSFEVSPGWYSTLQQSATRQPGGASWLHLLFLGTIELERAHSAQAAATLKKSHDLRPNPHAARALALLTPCDPDPCGLASPAAAASCINSCGAWGYYMQAWDAIDGWDRADPLRAPTADALVREICEFGRSAGMRRQLEAFVHEKVPSSLHGSDAVQYTIAYAAMHPTDNQSAPDWKTAMGAIESNCWPTYVGSDHLGLLSKLWTEAAYERYAAENGMAPNLLTPLDGQKARLLYPPPRNIGGRGS